MKNNANVAERPKTLQARNTHAIDYLSAVVRMFEERGDTHRADYKCAVEMLTGTY